MAAAYGGRAPRGVRGGTLIYPLLMGMGIPIYTHYMYLWGYPYIPLIYGYGVCLYRGRGGKGGYLYIPTIYVYVHMLIYILYMCYVYMLIYILYMCMYKGLYIQCLCYTNSPYLYKGMGVCLYMGGMVGQSARRLCTLFNFQRLPQYTNSRVVYKDLCVSVLYMRMGVCLYT